MAEPNSDCAERWLPVVGFENRYSVSSMGRIRADYSIRRYVAGRIIRPSENGVGYLRLTLVASDRKMHQFLVHRLVLLAFVGPCPDGYNANHKNGVKTDNRLENLEWVTFSENQLHRCYVLGKIEPGPKPKFGEDHPHSKLTDSDILGIRLLCRTGALKQREIGNLFGIGQNTVSKINRRVAWPHIV